MANASGNTIVENRKKSVHPITKRLNDDSTLFEISPSLLIKAGFASFTLGLFTLFRHTPVILFKIVSILKGDFINRYKIVILSVLFGWSGLVMFVFFILGIVLVNSSRIKSKHPLLLHPWGLLLLYMDVFVWVSLVLWLHLEVLKTPELQKILMDKMYMTDGIFIVMYTENVLFCLLHYTYASFFIIAELTAIDKFY